MAHHGKSLISAFQEFFANIKKKFIIVGEMRTGLALYGGRSDFPDIF